MSNVRHELLIVDDEPDILSLLKDALETENLEIFAAKNGKEAQEIVSKRSEGFPFDLILCDIQMPLVNGFQFLEELRRLRVTTPLIFLTAHGDRSNIIRALQLGAHDFIDKPFEINLLRKVVRQGVEFGRQRRSVWNEVEQKLAHLTLTPQQRVILETATAEIIKLKNIKKTKIA